VDSDRDILSANENTPPINFDQKLVKSGDGEFMKETWVLGIDGVYFGAYPFKFCPGVK
jgi:hypothetical protein